MSSQNFVFSRVEHEKSFIISGPSQPVLLSSSTMFLAQCIVSKTTTKMSHMMFLFHLMPLK